jgi:hypothetical protein
LAVVLLPDHLDVQEAIRRVHVLRRVVEAHEGDLGIGLEPASQAFDGGRDAGIHRATGAARVDHDARRRDRARPHGGLEDVVTPDRLEVAGDALVGAGPELQREERQREEQQEARRRSGDGLRVAHDEAREDGPEAAIGVGAPLEPRTRQDAYAVEPGADEREHGR